jgi:hypothetical protein
MKYVASKNPKAFMADLKCVYKAATLNAAEIPLDELEAKWGAKYPMVIKSWRGKWPRPRVALRMKTAYSSCSMPVYSRRLNDGHTLCKTGISRYHNWRYILRDG